MIAALLVYVFMTILKILTIEIDFNNISIVISSNVKFRPQYCCTRIMIPLHRMTLCVGTVEFFWEQNSNNYVYELKKLI